MKFNFPYYPQTSEFTCGPACVLMVMKHFDPKIRMTRHLEFEVWRKCNMIGIRGADPYGLAVALIEMGLEVRLITRRRKVIEEKPWRHRLVRHFSREEIELSFYGMRENQRRATERNLPCRCRLSGGNSRQVRSDRSRSHGSDSSLEYSTLGCRSRCSQGYSRLQRPLPSKGQARSDTFPREISEDP
jgi:hypothetical protein